MIRIFVATSPNGMDAEACLALEHSIRSRASRPVAIEWMRLTRDPASPWYSDPDRGLGWRTGNWATPFSGFRWAIPKLCGYEGRAIYMDVDTLVRADIAELWEMDLAGKVVASRDARRFCVSLWDCAAARDYGDLLPNAVRGNEALVRRFPATANWNCLDGDGLPFDDPSIRCLHFTDIATQPHIPLALERLRGRGGTHWFDGELKAHWRPELARLWRGEFEAGLKAGLRVADYEQTPPFGRVPKRELKNYRGGPRLAASR